MVSLLVFDKEDIMRDCLKGVDMPWHKVHMTETKLETQGPNIYGANHRHLNTLSLDCYGLYDKEEDRLFFITTDEGFYIHPLDGDMYKIISLDMCIEEPRCASIIDIDHIIKQLTKVEQQALIGSISIPSNEALDFAEFKDGGDEVVFSGYLQSCGHDINVDFDELACIWQRLKTERDFELLNLQTAYKGAILKIVLALQSELKLSKEADKLYKSCQQSYL